MTALRLIIIFLKPYLLYLLLVGHVGVYYRVSRKKLHVSLNFVVKFLCRKFLKPSHRKFLLGNPFLLKHNSNLASVVPFKIINF